MRAMLPVRNWVCGAGRAAATGTSFNDHPSTIHRPEDRAVLWSEHLAIKMGAAEGASSCQSPTDNFGAALQTLREIVLEDPA